MRRVARSAFAGAALFGLTHAGAYAQDTKIEIVSSPPDLVTMPYVIVRVQGTNLQPEGWASNDTLVTPFYQAANGDWFGILGYIDYLVPGENFITVIPNRGDFSKQVTFPITVYDADTPLFGAPRRPGACTQQTLGLSATPLQNACDKPHAEFVYRASDGTWNRWVSNGYAAAGTATTSGGQKAPAIARVEQGIIDGAPYAIAFLDDPASTAAEPWPAGPSAAVWNGTLVFLAGGLAGDAAANRVGFFDIGAASAGPASSCAAALVGQGYAVASVDTAVGPADQDAAAASALLRVKERFIKTYGLPTQTVGLGQSADQQAALARIAGKYPGLDSVATMIGSGGPHCP